MSQHLRYRGTMYTRVAHTSEETARFVAATFGEVASMLTRMQELLHRTEAQTKAIVQDPSHDELDIAVVVARVGGGVKQNLKAALRSLELAEALSTRADIATAAPSRP